MMTLITRKELKSLIISIPMILLPLIACSEEKRELNDVESGVKTSDIKDHPFTMALDSTLDLPQASPEVAKDSLTGLDPKGKPVPFGIEKGRITLRVTGDRTGTIVHTFRDYGRYERRVDSTVARREEDLLPILHELMITTPEFSGSYNFDAGEGWRSQNVSLAQYLKSKEKDSLTLIEYSLNRAGAKRLKDTTINGYQTRVYRLSGGPIVRTIWMWRGVPIRVHTFIRENGIQYAFEPVSIELDIETPDSLFEFPKEYNIVDRPAPPISAVPDMPPPNPPQSGTSGGDSGKQE